MEYKRNWNLTRREFLKVSSISACTLSLKTLALTKAQGAEPESSYPYKGWEDLYRKKWTWDKVVKGTHLHVHCCENCAWDIYVKDGIVFREEQRADYPPDEFGLPDCNPRGCQKGACYSELMYSPRRIKYPLKRAGKRGEGKWKRISWDEALDETAEKIIEIIKNHGPGAIYHSFGNHLVMDISPGTIARHRFTDMLGFPRGDTWGGDGDLNVGLHLTYGLPRFDGTSIDWCNSDYIIMWGINIICTQPVEFHYLTEARYKGAKVVTIAPDYSPSSIHSDLWIPVEIGTDAALGLGMAHVIIKEKLYKEDYVKEQTDLPLLVREDTGLYLRERDLEKGGKEDIFYLWDLRSNGIKKAPGSMGSVDKTLALGDMDPALEGSWEVETLGGKVKVTTVFEMLKKRLEDYTPEKASRITGVASSVIENMAREIARAKALIIFFGWSHTKFYHCDLMERAKCLLLSLTGNMGKFGAGARCKGATLVEGYLYSAFPAMVAHMKEKKVPPSRMMPEVLWLYVHAGQKEASQKYNPPLKRPFDEYLKESLEKGWMPLYPEPGKETKMLLECGGDILKRSRANTTIKEFLLPRLDFIVDINFRIDSTALNSDIVLPAAGIYEKVGIKYPMSCFPFTSYNHKAIEPLYESKDEWEIFSLLAKKVEQKAKEKGFTQYRDEPCDRTVNLANFNHEFTEEGKFNDPDYLMKWILDRTTTSLFTLEEIKEKGTGRMMVEGPKKRLGVFVAEGKWKGQAYSPVVSQVEEKRPWWTLTGRQQFYIDHPWFLEEGEELPCYKEPLKAGGDYPLRIVGGHTRWSIHSVWRDDKYMLRLQRGVPIIYINIEDAKKRGINDGDNVRVYNDLGDFKVHAKVSPALRPGQLIMYHAWEYYQFEGQKHFQAVMPSPIKPLNMAGGYGHLYYDFVGWQPNQIDRDTKVEVEKV